MLRLHPAIRTGLIYAGVHQAWALLGLVGIWINDSVFFLSGAVLFFTDLPAIFLAGVAGFYNSNPTFLSLLQKMMPKMSGAQVYTGHIVVVLTLGALQWFLIGYAVALRRARQSRKQAL